MSVFCVQLSIIQLTSTSHSGLRCRLYRTSNQKHIENQSVTISPSISCEKGYASINHHVRRSIMLREAQ